MYSRFYGFSERPFDITPDPRFLYLSPSHREVLASLIYGIRERRGFIAVLGEAGSGKTTLLRSALDHLKENVKVAYIFNTDVTFPEMLQMLLADLGLTGHAERLNKVEAFDRLNQLAIRQLSSGGTVVIMADEAQNLDRGCLENLRLLTNLETRKHKLIQIVLSGQPELEEKLRRPDLRQLSQRINLRRYILPLSETETNEYIEQRLRVAGYTGPPLFTKKAGKMLWQFSGGIPRIINTVCDNALLIAFALEKKRVGEKVVKEAIEDLSRERFRKESQPQTPNIARATDPEGRSQGRRMGFFPLILLACLLSLAVGAFIGIRGIDWGGGERISFQNRVRAVIPAAQARLTDHSSPPPSPLDNTPQVFLPPVDESSYANFAEREDPLSEEYNAGGLEEAVYDLSPEAAAWVAAREGDCLQVIIARFYGRYSTEFEQKVLEANPSIKDPDRIYVNQRIVMPGLSDNHPFDIR